MISPAEYRQRRQDLMAKIGQGSAIFASAPLAIAHHDVEHPFRQDSSFYYLTGFNEPGSVAVLAPHHQEHQFVLFVQPRDLEKETWTGYRTGVEKAKELYGADEVYPFNELDEKLPQYLEKADRLYYHFGADEKFNQRVLKHWQHQVRLYQKKGMGPMALEDPAPTFSPLRLLKSPTEIELTRKAVEIAIEAHDFARKMTKAGVYEYQIQAEIEHIFKLNGGSTAYPSIVASGQNSCILHYIDNNRQLQDGDLLLIDAGCCYQYYNSDITRTFPVSGQFTKHQQILYELVLEAQKQAIAEVKPGNPFNAVHDRAVSVLVDGLIDLGLLQGDKEEIIKEEKYKPFYMHRTSHWLGLDVHDAGAYKQGEETWTPLQPGQILTVEPGLYLSPEIKPVEGQPEVPPEWRGIGIRIEDDVLVTPDGHEVLTAAVPK